MEKFNLANDLIDFIYESPSAFHVVANSEDRLVKNGFEKLSLSDRWSLKEKGKYFVTVNDSAVFAFTMGDLDIEKQGFKIIGSHSDAPTFKIKPNSEIVSENAYVKLNVETYGGPILNTWLDRPLSIAGKVTLKSDNVFKPEIKLVNIKRPLLIIPNLAIHMNRTVNTGFELNKQKDMLPLIGMVNETFEKNNYLLKLIAEELKVELTQILSFELFLYEYEKGCVFGANNEFISSSRLDDTSMAHASLEAIINSENSRGINVCAIFDNEEIGSRTKQGADSNTLPYILERICTSLSKDREDYFRALSNSFMISADLAHAVHPNSGEKHDPTNRPVINGGPVIKISANMRYCTDSESEAIYESICKDANIPVQKFVNKSDMAGGSTIGPVSASHLPIKAVDMGSPILGMHSVRELAGVDDHYYTTLSFLEFYNK